MAAERIVPEGPGRLKVPDHPLVPVLPGDGVGPALWKASRKVLDAAVKGAYAGRRSLEWQELAGVPELLAALGAGPVGLCGPLEAAPGLPPPATALAVALDLPAALVRVRSLPGVPGSPAKPVDVLVACEAREGAAVPVELSPFSPVTNAFLAVLRRDMPRESRRVRFGTPERTDSYLRATGRRVAARVEVAAALLAATRGGALRLVDAAVRAAMEAGRRKLDIVFGEDAFPVHEDAFREWAQHAAGDMFDDERAVLTRRARVRAHMRGGPDAVRDQVETLEKHGGLYVDEVPLAQALERAVTAPHELDVVVASSVGAGALVPVLAGLVGGRGTVPVVLSNPITNRTLFGPLHGPAMRLAGGDQADPVATLLAGELLLRHLGWPEAAEQVLRAVGRALEGGARPADLAARAPGAAAAPATATAFADACVKALA